MQETYQTQNTALALTLATCGAQIPTDDAGNPVPCVHFYDKDTLARLGFKGQKIEAAAQSAFDAGKPGVVVYQFVKNDLLHRVIKAFDEQNKLIRTQESSRKSVHDAGGVNVSPEDAARIICQALHNRKATLAAWKSVDPVISIFGATRKSTDDKGRTITEGSMKAYSLGASAETKKRIGV